MNVDAKAGQDGIGPCYESAPQRERVSTRGRYSG
jgi:hypothetical protein